MAFCTPTSVVFSTFFTICEYASLAALEPAGGGLGVFVDAAGTRGEDAEVGVPGDERTGWAARVGVRFSLTRTRVGKTHRAAIWEAFCCEPTTRVVCVRCGSAIEIGYRCDATVGAIRRDGTLIKRQNHRGATAEPVVFKVCGPILGVGLREQITLFVVGVRGTRPMTTEWKHNRPAVKCPECGEDMEHNECPNCGHEVDPGGDCDAAYDQMKDEMGGT